MSENKLSIRQSKNNSRISPNKNTKVCDESKQFDEVKAGTPKAITYGRGCRDSMGSPASSIHISDKLMGQKFIKLLRFEKSDKSRIPVNKSFDTQCIDAPPRQYEGVKSIKSSTSKGESKFGFRLSPNKLQSDQSERIENDTQPKDISDHKPNIIERILKSPLRETGNAADFYVAQSSLKAEVKSNNFSSPVDEGLMETSNQASKTDTLLDQTFVKSQRLSEIIEETELPLDQTFVKSERLSELIDETSNRTPVSDQSSSQTEVSPKELKSTELNGEFDANHQQQLRVDGLRKDEQIPSSSRTCSEENDLFLKSFKDESFEPLPTIHAENPPQIEYGEITTDSQSSVVSDLTVTTTRVKIMKQLEDLSLKLYRNRELLTEAIQLRTILVGKMKSEDDVSPEGDLCKQMEKFAKVVDIHTREVPAAVGEDIQLDDIGFKDHVYPVPWAGVKTVGFLFSLIGSDNVVSLSPREAATTINKDVLMAHYKNYLQRAKSKQDMVDTIKKILLDTLELVEGRMKTIRGFMDTWGPLMDGTASKEYYEEHRSLLLECRVYLRQAADDCNLVYGRTDQYAVERSGLLDELKMFLRTQVRLFPEYKDLSP